MKEKPRTDQANLVKVFIGGSLLIILLGLSSAAILFAYSFLNKEQARATISREQLAHFFQFNRVAMSEDMSSRLYDSISGRVGTIAHQMGDAEYEMVLTNARGECIRAESTGGTATKCVVPPVFGTMLSTFTKTLDPAAVVQFQKASRHYLYMTPLLIGESLKGFLYVSLSDPYEFYRGNLFTIILRTLLPALTFILILWFLWLFACRRFFLKPYLEGLTEMKQNERAAQIARHTVHDLREPLTQLSDYVKKLPKLSEDERIFITGTTLELEDIAYGLLDHSRIWSGKGTRTEVRAEHLESLIQRVVAKKRSQLGLRKNLSVEFNTSPATFSIFGEIYANDFRRVLANLIRNSVEAMDKDNGLIQVSLRENGTTVTVEVADNGKGIPAHIVPRLFQPDETYGKRNGNGLGLAYSKQVLESCGGEIHLSSEEGRGTTVKITLRKFVTPDWFPSQIEIRDVTDIVVIDDNAPAHDRWEARFSSIAGRQIHHLSSEAEFLKWFEKREEARNYLYLFDYELGSSSRNGLEIIDEVEVYDDAILVTHHFEDEEIRKACGRLGIRLMPKDLIERIPIAMDPTPGFTPALAPVEIVEDSPKGTLGIVMGRLP